MCPGAVCSPYVLIPAQAVCPGGCVPLPGVRPGGAVSWCGACPGCVVWRPGVWLSWCPWCVVCPWSWCVWCGVCLPGVSPPPVLLPCSACATDGAWCVSASEDKNKDRCPHALALDSIGQQPQGEPLALVPRGGRAVSACPMRAGAALCVLVRLSPWWRCARLLRRPGGCPWWLCPVAVPWRREDVVRSLCSVPLCPQHHACCRALSRGALCGAAGRAGQAVQGRPEAVVGVLARGGHGGTWGPGGGVPPHRNLHHFSVRANPVWWGLQGVWDSADRRARTVKYSRSR